MPQRMSNKNLVVNFSTRRVSGIKRFEETKLIIRIRKSKKDKQRNGQKEKDKNDLNHTLQNTKDRATQTPLRIDGWTWVLRKG
jgi:hypothetical protein